MVPIKQTETNGLVTRLCKLLCVDTRDRVHGVQGVVKCHHSFF